MTENKIATLSPIDWWRALYGGGKTDESVAERLALGYGMGVDKFKKVYGSKKPENITVPTLEYMLKSIDDACRKAMEVPTQKLARVEYGDIEQRILKHYCIGDLVLSGQYAYAIDPGAKDASIVGYWTDDPTSDLGLNIKTLSSVTYICADNAVAVERVDHDATEWVAQDVFAAPQVKQKRKGMR